MWCSRKPEKNNDACVISCSLRKMDIQRKMAIPSLNMKILKLQKWVSDILSHWRWTAMAVMNIVLRWQWTLMVVMTLYKRTSELQRWWTTPAMMNSIDEPAIFNSGELLRQLWTCLFQLEFALLHKTPKKWLPMSLMNPPPKNAQKDSMSVMKSPFQECQKEFLRGWWSLLFSASKVSGTTVVTPFPVWCACSLNRKIPLLETSPKTASRMPGNSKRWLA